MTIYELNSKRESIKNDIDELQKLIIGIQKCSDQLQPILNKAGITNDPTFTINSAKNLLIDYGRLLEQITHQTQIEWPPTSGPAR